MELNTNLVLVRKEEEEIKSVLVFIVPSVRNENEQKCYENLRFFFLIQRKSVENSKSRLILLPRFFLFLFLLPVGFPWLTFDG